MRTKLQTLILIAFVFSFSSGLVFGASMKINAEHIKALQDKTGLNQIPKMLLSRKLDKRNALPCIASADQVAETLVEVWDENQWKNEMFLGYSYDSNGNQTFAYSNMWDEGAWVDANRTTQTFNGNNQITSMLSEFYNVDSGTWMTSANSTFTYNGNGFLVEWISQIADPASGMILFGMKYSMTYDATGFNMESLMEAWDMSTQQWQKFSRSNYTSLSSTKVEEIDQTWSGSGWINDSRYVSTFGGDGFLVEDIFSTWNGNDWDLSSKDTYVYDANGNEVEWISQQWDGSSWLNSDRTTSTWDANGNEAVSYSYSWNNNGWEIYDGSKYENTYQNGNLYQQIYSTWTLADWVTIYRYTYFYNGATNVDMDTQVRVPESYALSNYPNPFNPETTIQFELPQAARANVSIYNIRGELIKTLTDQQLSAGSHLITWDGTNYNNQSVSSGVYLYKLTTGNMSMTKRCMFLK